MDLGLEQSLSKSSHNCLFLVLFGNSEKKMKNSLRDFCLLGLVFWLG